MKITLIAAVSESNGVIGADNQLPWHLPSDLKQFKEYTMGKTIVMGRKTFESLPGPLAGRTHIVLSSDDSAVQKHIDAYKQRTEDENIPHIFTMSSIKELMDSVPALQEYDKNIKTDELVVIGGENIYQQFMTYANKMVLTMIKSDNQIVGDRFFPHIDMAQWDRTDLKEVSQSESDEYPFYTVTLERKTDAMIISFDERRALHKHEAVSLQEELEPNPEVRINNKLDGLELRVRQLEDVIVDVLDKLER